MVEEEDCGNLKISRFSGRFPDRRNCFSCAYAPEKTERDVHAAAPLRVKRDFDTLHENLRIFMEGEEDCGNLKICGFSGRFPDRRNCFSCACAPEKTERDVHAAALDWKGICPQAFSTVWEEGPLPLLFFFPKIV